MKFLPNVLLCILNEFSHIYKSSVGLPSLISRDSLDFFDEILKALYEGYFFESFISVGTWSCGGIGRAYVKAFVE
jgi:hypothetical protein